MLHYYIYYCSKLKLGLMNFLACLNYQKDDDSTHEKGGSLVRDRRPSTSLLLDINEPFRADNWEQAEMDCHDHDMINIIERKHNISTADDRDRGIVDVHDHHHTSKLRWEPRTKNIEAEKIPAHDEVSGKKARVSIRARSNAISSVRIFYS